jgi:hypothetical protein
MRRIYGSRIVDPLNDRLRFYYWIGEEVSRFEKVVFFYYFFLSSLAHVYNSSFGC